MATREKLQLEANEHRAAAREHQVAAVKLDATLAIMPLEGCKLGDWVLAEDGRGIRTGAIIAEKVDGNGDLHIAPYWKNGRAWGDTDYVEPANCTPLPRNLPQILKDLAAIDVPDGKVIVGVRPPKEGEQIILRSGEIVNAVSGIESLHVIVEDKP